MRKSSRAALRVRVGLWLAVVALPLALVGCSAKTAAPATTTTAPPAPANSTGQAAGNSTGQAAGNSTGQAAGNSTGQAADNSTGQAAANSTGQAAGNSTGQTAGSNTVGSVTVATSAPQVILYAPAVQALNTVRVSGRVLGVGGGQAVTVSARFSGADDLVASHIATTAADGQFVASLPVYAAKTPVLLTFEAAVPGAASAGVTRYFNNVPMAGNEPSIMLDTRADAIQMGATLPVLLPTWLPQTLSLSAPTRPCFSTSVAAKSFTYTVSIFQTTKPFAVYMRAPELTNSPVLATVDGTQFSNDAAAMKQLMLHANESLPNAAVASQSIRLTSALAATGYADQWHTIVWHEGDWLLAVRGPNAAQNLQEARRLAVVLNTVYLPPTNGVVWVRNIADGSGQPATPTVEVSFAEGTNLYQVVSQGHVYDPLVLASSLRG